MCDTPSMPMSWTAFVASAERQPLAQCLRHVGDLFGRGELGVQAGPHLIEAVAGLTLEQRGELVAVGGVERGGHATSAASRS